MAEPIELILLRQWASFHGLPVWLMDGAGTLLFYNEAAEGILGKRFEETGEITMEELADIFVTRSEDGTALTGAELPIGIALIERRPAHGRLRIETWDSRSLLLEVTAFPVLGHAARFHGAVALFWEALP